MRPMNFPERKRLRRVAALERAGEPVPSELRVNVQGIRTKKAREGRRARG